MKERSKVTKERKSNNSFQVVKRLSTQLQISEEMKIDQQHPSKRKNLGSGNYKTVDSA